MNLVRRTRLRTSVLIIIALVAIVLSCGSIDPEELECEEGAARVSECCPQIDPHRFNCVFEQGCNPNQVPIFTKHAAECLHDTACDDLVARGICDSLEQTSFLPMTLQKPDVVEQEACR